MIFKKYYLPAMKADIKRLSATSHSRANFYIARLQSHCIETGISVRRDCNLSMVRLESHFAEIIWYWDAMSLILYAMPATRHIGLIFILLPPPLQSTSLHCPFGDSSGKLKLPSSSMRSARLVREPTLILRVGVPLKGRQFFLVSYLVSENLSDTPKSWVEVGYDEADTTGMLVWWS